MTMDGNDDDAALLGAARRIERQSRSRSAVFEAHPGLFRDPAWSMLLAIFIADHDRGPLPVKSLGASSGVPMTTALRYVMLLEEAGLIEKNRSTKDRRSTLVRLSQQGRKRMVAFLNSQV